MFRNVFGAFNKLSSAAWLFAAVLITTCGAANAPGQETAQITDSRSKENAAAAHDSEAEKKSAVDARSGIKVVFDESAPGVVIVESNGEKIRVDTSKKTVEQLNQATAAVEKNAAAQPANENTTVAANAKQEEESQFDFDPGDEPYDYRLINVPTPKKVPKGSINLSFSHRFSQPVHPIKESGRNLLGFDSFSVSSFGVSYGITDKLFVSASRSPICQKGLCRTVEIGFGYQFLEQSKNSRFGLTGYVSMEGNGNFTEEYNYNFQAMLSARVHKRVYLFFSPAFHLNANGQKRFNPRPDEFFPPATLANDFKLPTNTISYGFGTSVLITPNLLALFEFTPRTGFKLGVVEPIFDNNFNVTGFRNKSYPEIGFGIQRNIGKHSFSLTFSNTQTTTTSRYNSSNLLLSPRRLVIGFNLFRRFGGAR